MKKNQPKTTFQMKYSNLQPIYYVKLQKKKQMTPWKIKLIFAIFFYIYQTHYGSKRWFTERKIKKMYAPEIENRKSEIEIKLSTIKPYRPINKYSNIAKKLI